MIVREVRVEDRTVGQLCREIVEGTPDAVIVADREGIIRFWNAGAAAMFGYSAEQALGRSLDLVIPDRQRERHWDGYRRVMATGVTRYASELLAVPALRADGSRISLEFTIVLLRGPDDAPLGAAAVMRDVTERWQREHALRERVAALEAAAPAETPE